VQAVDILLLVRVKGCHHVVPRSPRFRTEALGCLGAQSSGRLDDVDQQPADPVIRVRSPAVQATPDRLGDSIVHDRQILAGGGVEMIEALRHRPGVGSRLPRELLVGERRNQRIGVSGDLLELCEELVDLGCKPRRSPGDHRSTILAHRM